MARILFIVFILYFSFFSRIGLAQHNEYFLQSHVNSQNGLPQNTIRDIAISSSGFMWIATEDGLVRFDGRNTRIYNKLNSCLEKNRIAQFIPTNDGKLYCLCEANLLYEIIETPPRISIQFVTKVPYLGLSGYHLFKPKNLKQFLATCTIISPESINNQYLSSLFFLKNEQIVRQFKSGLQLYSADLTLLKTLNFTFSNSDHCFSFENDIYVYNENGFFFKVDFVQGRMNPMQADNILQGKLHFYWNGKTKQSYLIRDRELYKINVQENSISIEKILDNLPEFKIENITMNNTNSDIIVGTLSNGCYIYHKQLFSILHSASSTDFFYAQSPSADSNSVYAGRPLQSIGKINQQKFKHDVIINESTMFMDKNKTCWFSKKDTLFYLKKENDNIKVADTLPNSYKVEIKCIYPKDAHSLYIVTQNALFTYKMDSGFTKLCDYNFPNKQRQPYCILNESDSILWIGTQSGLYAYNISNKQFKLICLEGLTVRTLFKTSNGLLLAGTYGNGIYCIQQKKAIGLPLDKNENLKSTHAFMEDRNRILWMSSNNGLYKTSIKEIDDYIRNRKKSTLYYYRYSYYDGLLTNEFNGGCFPSAIAVNNNTWSFPSMQGLVWFQPDSMPLGQNNASIYIDKVLLNDTLIYSNNPNLIETKTHNFKLSLFLAAPNWSDDDNLQIEYKIDNHDAETTWNLLKDNKIPLVLQNLSGGNHLIKIRKRKGILNEEYQEISIHIQVPQLIYEHRWFWPLCLAALILFGFGLNRISILLANKKKKKLEQIIDTKTIELKKAIHLLETQNVQITKSESELKKESELKSTLLFLLSHDIASPLRHINIFLGAAGEHANAPALSSDDFIDLKISTNNLENLLDNIVAWIKHTNNTNSEPIISPHDLYSMVQEKINLFDLAIKKKSIQVINMVPVGTVIYTDRFICSMALQNLLGNAINYIKKGSIEISFSETPTYYEIKVVDTGIGISSKMLELMAANDNIFVDHKNNEILGGYGIGLKLTAKLLQLIHGKLILKQNENLQGTIAIISINRSNLGTLKPLTLNK